MKILYLEDDISLGQTIEEYLEDNGFEVSYVKNGSKALDILFKKSFDLLLLDVNVPGINGFELLKSLRDANQQTPAIFTTSLNSIDDLSNGYECGADDYLKKPFALKELLFRIKAVLKREYNSKDQVITINEHIQFNVNTHTLLVDTKTYSLNPKESELLKLLLKYKNNCVTFELIFENVWSFEQENNFESLRTYIKNLRKYLGKESILNIKKQGYMFV